MDEKECTRCYQTKLVKEFPSTDGRYRAICRNCYNERRRAVRPSYVRPEERYVPMEKPPGALLPPYVKPLGEREVYVPPKWGR